MTTTATRTTPREVTVTFPVNPAAFLDVTENATKNGPTGTKLLATTFDTAIGTVAATLVTNGFPKTAVETFVKTNFPTATADFVTALTTVTTQKTPTPTR